jgi:hypothetical protein
MAMSEKLGQTLKAASTFFTGFILAFIKGWDMTLVMLGCIPLMGVMGAVMMSAISKSTQTQNAAYARASMVAQQSISQVRTVAAPTPPSTPRPSHLPPHLSPHTSLPDPYSRRLHAGEEDATGLQGGADRAAAGGGV